MCVRKTIIIMLINTARDSNEMRNNVYNNYDMSSKNII